MELSWLVILTFALGVVGTIAISCEMFSRLLRELLVGVYNYFAGLMQKISDRVFRVTMLLVALLLLAGSVAAAEPFQGKPGHRYEHIGNGDWMDVTDRTEFARLKKTGRLPPPAYSGAWVGAPAAPPKLLNPNFDPLVDEPVRLNEGGPYGVFPTALAWEVHRANGTPRGALIARFYNEDNAIDYARWMNSQVEKPVRLDDIPPPKPGEGEGRVVTLAEQREQLANSQSPARVGRYVPTTVNVLLIQPRSHDSHGMWGGGPSHVDKPGIMDTATGATYCYYSKNQGGPAEWVQVRPPLELPKPADK